MLLFCSRLVLAGQVVQQTRQIMGTYVGISVWSEEKAVTEAAMEKAYAQIERIDRTYSTYKPGSALSKLNRQAASGPVTVSDEMLFLLKTSAMASEASTGAFDITFKGLDGLWDFHAEKPRIPPAEEISKKLPFVNYRHVLLNEKTKSVRFAKKGVAIGLGGIVKGYASDLAAKALEACGFTNYIINSGGDMRVSGDKGGKSWHIGVQNPRSKRGELVAVISGAKGAVVTSGDYERFFLLNGKRYHHILDPRTGTPAIGCMSVTVVADQAMRADWLSTAVFVLGPVKGMELVERTPGAEALIIKSDGHRETSSGFQKAVAIEYLKN